MLMAEQNSRLNMKLDFSLCALCIKSQFLDHNAYFFINTSIEPNRIIKVTNIKL